MCRRASNLKPKRPIRSVSIPVSMRLKPNLVTDVCSKVREPLSSVVGVSKGGLGEKIRIPSLGEGLG